MRKPRERERDIAEAVLALIEDSRQEASMAGRPGPITSEPSSEPSDLSTGAVLAAKLKERLSSAELTDLQSILEKILD